MTMTPPAGAEESNNLLNLQPVTPAEEVVQDETAGIVPKIDRGKELELDTRARNFTTDLIKYDVHSPEFKERVKELGNLAKATILTTSEAPNRMLDRAQSSVMGSKRAGGDASVEAAKSLTKLRGLVEELTPNQADLLGVSKILGIIPGGNKLKRYFHKYQSAQVQLNSIINNLLKSQDELAKDSASLEQEQLELRDNMKKLNEYAMLAGKLDEEITREISQLRGAGNVQGAQALENDVLFTVRQRRQDILTQLAAAAQGYLAMDVVQKNNTELIKSVERARSVTVTALKTAVVIASALDNQKLVLDQIDVLRNTTENVMLRNAQMLKQQTGRVAQQAADPAVSLKVLEDTFRSVVETMDIIDASKEKANQSMQTTINSLENHLQKTKPVLERAKAISDATKDSQAAILGGEI